MSRCNLFESSDSEEDELDSLCNNNACSSGKSSAGYSSVARYEPSPFLHGTLNNSIRNLNKSIDNIQTRVVQHPLLLLYPTKTQPRCCLQKKRYEKIDYINCW